MGLVCLRPFLWAATLLYMLALSVALCGSVFILALGSRGACCHSET